MVLIYSAIKKLNLCFPACKQSTTDKDSPITVKRSYSSRLSPRIVHPVKVSMLAAFYILSKFANVKIIGFGHEFYEKYEGLNLSALAYVLQKGIKI